MAVVTLGPLAFASNRLAAIIGIFVFLGLCMSCFTSTASSMIGGAIGVAITLVLLMRESRQTLPLAAVPLVSGVFVWVALTTLWQAAEGPAAPRFTLARLDGSQFVALAEREGRPAVVNFWATWCPSCRREIPILAEVAGGRTDVDFIFANQGERPATIQSYLDDENLELENILLDPSHSLSRHYAAPGMPVTLFPGTDGQVVTTHFGEISREALNAAIARLIPADKE